MQEHNVTQGSPEWLALRAAYFTASEAPAMMGCSPYMTRTELLRQKHTGAVADVDAGTQRIYDKGHAAEAAARPAAEAEVGEDLYPVTGSLEVEGLPLLASFDGLTMDGSVVWEHKLYSQANADHIESHPDNEPPIHHVWQLEQQLLVSGAEMALFTTSDGTPQNELSVKYYSKPERRAALLAGWKQFAQDLATYTPSIATEAAPVGRAPDMLPALHIEVTGMVTASNLAEFKAVALTAIRGVNRTLDTDQDFADGEKSVKWCADVETRIAAAKQHALSQTASIDELFRVMDEVSAEARTVRLALEKLVKARKAERRDEIQAEAMDKLVKQIMKASAGLGSYAPHTPADARLRIADAMKGKKTIASLQDAADTERAAIAMELTGRINQRLVGLSVINAQEQRFTHLWPDVAQLIELPVERLNEVLAGRIAKHEADESARLEAERARIRAEEQAKAEREVQARVDAERRAAEAAARAEVEAASAMAKAATVAPVAMPVIAAAPQPEPAYEQHPAVAVVDTTALMNLGNINSRIAPLSISADGLAQLGFPHVQQIKASKLYRECDFPQICRAMAQRLRAAVEGVPA